MSDDTSSIAPAVSSFDLDRYERERLESVRQQLPEFARRLKSAGVVRVEIQYDGSGDSGQIEALTGFDGNDAEVDMTRIAGINESELMDLFYDLTQARHPGWENNEGAFGEFTWRLTTEELTHVHNDRLTEYDTTEHEGL